MKAAIDHLRSSGAASRTTLGVAAALALAAFVWPFDGVPDARMPVLAPEPLGDAALSRPPFDPGRRAWTARGTRAAVLEGEPHRPIIAVRGIVLDGTQARVLVDDGSGDDHWLVPGQGRNDWRITAIAADRVTLSQNGRSYTAEFMGPPATLRAARPPQSPLDSDPPALRP